MDPRFQLTILGCNSAMPAYGRFPTSQVLQVGNELILLDCGEGAQIRMAEYKIKRNEIRYVLISHMHGDHIYGLPGFIGSLAHMSRTKALDVYGPQGIKEYLETCLRTSYSHINFPLHIHEIGVSDHTVLLETSRYEITSFPVNHRIPASGYLIEEKSRERNIKKEAIAEYNLTVPEIKAVKAGEDVLRGDVILPADELAHPVELPRSYGYCGDSQVDGWDTDLLKKVGLLYFESTYLDDMREIAHERGHATAKEAALLARSVEAGQLVIGHYSSRYREVGELLDEAQAVFPDTIAGYDGCIIHL